MQVGILGPLEVYDGAGAPIQVTGARLRTLLVRLALDAGRPVSAGELVDAVWGEQPPADAANALQTLVSRLRRTLGDAALIGQSPAGYRLGIDPHAVDVHRFESLAAQGTRALRDGDPDAAFELLQTALALWRGAALSDGGDTLRTAATRLEELRIGAVVDRAAAGAACGDATSSLSELENLANQLPNDERVAVALVTALAQAGRQADALRAYERTRENLADELGADPGAELQKAHLAVLRDEVTPVEPSAPRRTNLKAQLTSFVGRDEDLARVEQALQQHRLVTLVGPGGAGKTRLAGEAGSRLMTRDGVWLAELAPVTDGADVAQVVLGALGLREKNLLDRRAVRGSLDAEARLVDVLADRITVLVLDNCEHVIDASARLAEQLLNQCPELRVLATSREPLGIIGEAVLAVPPLGQPAADAAAAAALEYPAVRLFADRAAAASPGFVVNDRTVATVIDIVRRLDGLPLAIELAAARLRTLPLAEIAARLSDRFRLLTGGSRTALPRHRTLRAVVEWSWELLSSAERALVERLAVFPAGLTNDSASAVGAGDRVVEADVSELLAALVDKSLLQRVGDGTRLRMLETIREYGVERLIENGELGVVRRRHADYFRELLRRAEPHLLQADQLPWIERLTDERENILAALRFCCDNGDADGALTIAIGLGGFAMLIGNHSDVSSWTAEALSVPGATDEQLTWVARGLYAMNAAAAGTGPSEAESGMSELKEVAANLSSVRSDDFPMVGILRPAIAFFAGDEELSRQMLVEGLTSEHAWVRAASTMFRVNFAENNGDVEGMRDDVASALTQFRALGERWGLGNTLRSLAMLQTFDGQLVEAEATYAEALDLMAQLRSSEDEAFLLVRLADLAMRQGDSVRAREVMGRAAVAAGASGSPLESTFILSMLAEMERQSGNLDTARDLQHKALKRIEGAPSGHPAAAHGSAIVLALSSRLAFAEGDRAGAAAIARDAYAACVATRDLPILAAFGVVVADIAAECGRHEAAARLLGCAARLRGADDLTAVDISALVITLRDRLGDRFDQLYADGKSLDRDAAMKQLDPAEALVDL